MSIKEFNVVSTNEGDFTIDAKFEEILKFIESGEPVLLRGLLSSEEVKHLRKRCIEWANSEPPNHPKDRSFGCKNYHSLYENNPKSVVKSILHAYTYFYWNDDSKEVSNYFQRLIRLRNLLTGLPKDYAITGEHEGKVSIPTVQQYPRGGGYMQEHMDPDVGQKVIVNTVLSRFSSDFKKGGVFYRDKDGDKVYVDPIANPGDALVFPPRIKHGVDPIDPDTEIDWTQNSGRWMCMAALVAVSSLNATDDGAAAGKPVQYN